ncbi:hypothetical protein LSUE1_G005212 [Lachnellula suecica]|uniref:F-box domain-containing protein n=1 Tax=Lachnellula suecica TaxID=602035 RepID=A0A8T9C1A7_9HELO|nr:hypothetical protein LSUE1_G005212 [Lachnellula suecica]
MTVISYHSTLVASSQEAVGTTSSQIFLSRGVAEPSPFRTRSADSSNLPSAYVTSVFESDSRHIMTLGDAASRTVCSNSESHTCSQEECSTAYSNRATEGDSTDPNSESSSSNCPVSPTGTSSPSNSPTPLISRMTGLALVDEPESEFPRTISDGVPRIDKGKGKQIDRGRTWERVPRFVNPLAGAESRSRRDDAAIEVDARPIGKRISRSSTFHDDPTDPCAILDDNLLEPCPHAPVCPTLSEVLGTPLRTASIASGLSRADTSASSHTSSGWSAPLLATLTTAFSACQSLNPAGTFTTDQFQSSHLDYLAIKSSSPIWTSRQTSFASQLPTEIMHTIFYNLGHADFNSARRVCRSWFTKSLDRRLLETMLRRGGFSVSIERDLTANHILDSEVRVNDEWLISKRLARECALGPNWTGNGLSLGLDLPAGAQEEEMHPAFLYISTVDFTEVDVHCSTTNTVGTVFTVSCCGRFVMAANGCLVYVYELNRHQAAADHSSDVHPGFLRPVTSIICPRRVLACSMDTSSHRYAIAILLDGRMGLVCDITALNQSARPPRNNPDSANNQRRDYKAPSTSTHVAATHVSDGEGFRGTSFLDRISLNSSGSNLGESQPSDVPPFVFPGIASTGAAPDLAGSSAWQDVFQNDVPECTRTAGPSSRHSSLPRASTLQAGRIQSILPPHQGSDSEVTSMPIETGPRSLYRNLCSDDDPPRSVAICPQRRCVAFGCSSGIELHWVDALTGQDLNRWFPLTAPSDFLFFLPPRRSVDSAKKLRLISSASRPNERPAIGERPFGSRSRSSPFWARVGRSSGSLEEGDSSPGRDDFLSRIRGSTLHRPYNGNGRLDYSDHYRAVPLSDGYHILFTDPSTRLLCMGSDAPVGGPTKLLRKIWFKGPAGQGSPTVYAAGSDLSWGVRIVAAYGSGAEQSVWLFSVPGDIFGADQGRNRSGGPSWPSSPPNEPKNMDWLDWWPYDGMQEFLNQNQDPAPGIHSRSVWPVKIQGQEIGRCQGVVDLAIDSGVHMIVWAFSKAGIAKVWKINVGDSDNVKRLSVVRDGTIREHDQNGDIEMPDAPSTSSGEDQPSHQLQETFDGSSSFTSAAYTARTTRQQRVERMHPSVRYDSKGDIVMHDVSHSDEDWQGSFECVAMAGFRGEVNFASQTWSRREVYGVDFMQEVTGITRINVEIH